MPNCPGCEKRVPYNRLDIHQRYCEELTDQPTPKPAVKALDHRLQAMEQQLNRRMMQLEARVKQNLSEQDQGQDTTQNQQYRR
jgi:hypothetical protein